MGANLLFLYALLQKYLVPFIFAIGLIYFVYGFITYFIIGHKGGDEGEMQKGRAALAKSFVFLLVAIVVQVAVVFIGYIGSALLEGTARGSSSNSPSVSEQRDILDVPNVPRTNE
ncbi:hypothetical protein KC722_01445 [Candidatus Kaiserbacteria bacterium]|nr:hypothetical protein [Candidatus Kaiserbacteria bacterium]